ncbi:MAG: phosphoribosylaminoimidazolesuccinocarboxamide synthase [Acidobacteria bacterium]|nr:phosphoribosylaminoimidazolesuccinocarboxamide synthase [Acidobacteriota bacterium]
MTSETSLFETSLSGLSPHRRGKVRDLYALEDQLLIVATDRISAYDLVLGSTIPDKGKVLTQLSAFWFDRTTSIVQNHLISTTPADYPSACHPHMDTLRGRSMLVRKTEPIPVECVARGYLVGSGWIDYQRTGSVCGVQLPKGLQQSDQLPKPIFTPATKATTGHDENISEAEAAKLVGPKLMAKLRDLTLALYNHGATHAESCGIIVADTKFEFGLIRNGDSQTTGTDIGDRDEIILIDEALTPDSSRFWPKEAYVPGRSQPSFDKQYVRDHLDQIKWNRQPPVPQLPDSVVAKTRDKYNEAYQQLTGRELEL